MTPTDPAALAARRQLCDEYGKWLAANTLPEISAEELVLEPAITHDQRRWLSDFIRRWQAMERAESAVDSDGPPDFYPHLDIR